MKRKILLIGLLLLLSLACGVVAEGTPTPEIDQEDRVATIVAATMASPNESIAIEPSPGDSTSTELPPAETENETTGLRIAYIRDGNIWLWTEGFGTRQLTNMEDAGNVKISDDGRLIAFTRQGELWAITSDGGNPFQLVNQAYQASVPRNTDYVGKTLMDSFEFIPGTHALFFDMYMETESYPYPFGGLHRVDADAPAPFQVLQEGQSGVRYYSPDKQWVALSQPSHIAIMRVDGVEYRTAFDFDPIFTYSEWSFHPEVVWKSSSDGFYLALPAADFLSNPSDPGRFWYIGLDGVSAQLAIIQASPVWTAIPQISPDGSRVLYIKEVGDGREIRIVDASTADTVFIASADADVGIIGWADNDHFGFWYGDIGKPWYASVSGHSQQDLTDVYPTSSSSIRWLKDGRLIFKALKELRLTTPGGPSLVIDAPLDFVDFDVAE